MKAFFLVLIFIFLSFLHCSENPQRKDKRLTAYPVPYLLTAFELYGWQESNSLFFTLVTLSDEEKTTKEITADNDELGQVKWYRVKVKGLDSIKFILRGMPKKSLVIWKSNPEGFEAVNSTTKEKLKRICEDFDLRLSY